MNFRPRSLDKVPPENNRHTFVRVFWTIILNFKAS
jgi:hypothetical protein